MSFSPSNPRACFWVVMQAQAGETKKKATLSHSTVNVKMRHEQTSRISPSKTWRRGVQRLSCSAQTPYYTWKIHDCEGSGARDGGSVPVSNGKMSDGQMSHLSNTQESIRYTSLGACLWQRGWYPTVVGNPLTGNVHANKRKAILLIVELIVEKCCHFSCKGNRIASQGQKT